MGNQTGKFRRQDRGRILILGLDAAGKSSILCYFKPGERINVEAVEVSAENVMMWIVGTRDRSRPLWKYIYPNIQALVLVVDSVDKEKIMEARDFLHSFLIVDDLNDVPMAIALNKRDFPDCMTREEMVEKLDLEKIQEQRPCETFLTTTKPTSDVDTENDKFLEWITRETGKSQNESPKNKKVGSLSSFIWQPIMKMKNKMFD